MTEEKRVFAPDAVNELLNGWLIHSHKARDRHDEASRRYANGHQALGIPSLILSSVVGSAVFAALSSKEAAQLWVGLMSILAAVLAALQTFMDFGARSEKHRIAGVKYKASIRLIEESRVEVSQGRTLSGGQVSAIRSMLDSLEETAPVVMPGIYDAVEKRYQDLKYVAHAINLYSKNST